MAKRIVRVTERMSFIYEIDGPDDLNEFDDLIEQMDKDGRLDQLMMDNEPADTGRTWSIDRTEDPTPKPEKKTKREKKVDAPVLIGADGKPWTPSGDPADYCTVCGATLDGGDARQRGTCGPCEDAVQAGREKFRAVLES